MKYEDYQIGEVALFTYQDFTIVIWKMLQPDPLRFPLPPSFYDQLRNQLRYLGIDPSSISELNSGNRQHYSDEVYALLDIFCQKYKNEIKLVCNDSEAVKNHLGVINFKEVLQDANGYMDIDLQNKIITFNQNCEKCHNASLKSAHNNKTYDPNDVEIWSVFQRGTESLYTDVIYLIYALKGEKQWMFKTHQDAERAANIIKLTAQNFSKSANGNAVIIIPDANHFHLYIADIFSEFLSECIVIKDDLRNIFTEEVCNNVMEFNSPFSEFYEGDFNDKFHELENYLCEMDKDEESGPYLRHLITDSEMKNVLDRTLSVCNEDYYGEINGKNILLIDKFINSGMSFIKDQVQVMNNCYAPKSITVLTMFSKFNNIN